MAAVSFVVVVAAAIFDLAASACTDAGDNCADTKCCSDPAMKCFKKNAYWASCKNGCDPTVVDAEDGKTWACDVLSAKASSSKCSKAGADCSKTGCCQRVDMTCFRKNEYWASCKKACDPSIPDEDDGSTWNCALMNQPAASGAPAPTPAPVPTTTPAPTFILDNSGNQRPVLYGP